MSKSKKTTEAPENLDLSPLAEEPMPTACAPKKCRWTCILMSLLVLSLLGSGAYFAVTTQKALEQKLSAAEKTLSVLQKDMVDVRQKIGTKSKSENVFETLLTALQNRLQSLESGQEPTSFPSRAITLFYFERSLDHNGAYLKALMPHFEKNLSSNFKEEMETLKKITLRHETLSKDGLLAEAKNIITPPETKTDVPETGIWGKFKAYLLGMITLHKKTGALFNLDETLALKEALAKEDVYAINSIFAPYALKNEGVERWLKICDDYRELKLTLSKIEEKMIHDPK